MKRLIKGERGASLVEVLMAMFIMAIVTTAFLMAIFTATKAIMVADERTNAESLARSQLESVKQQEYKDAPLEGVATYSTIAGVPSTYSIWSVSREGTLVNEVLGIPWDSQSDEERSDDVGLQKITLKIYRGDGEKEILTLEGYKVDESVYH